MAAQGYRAVVGKEKRAFTLSWLAGTLAATANLMKTTLSPVTWYRFLHHLYPRLLSFAIRF
ncbi:hypothetical protein ACNKHP_05165 [Shigella boydii]